MQGFHRTYATGAAYHQRTLTPPDTWSCPIWDLQMFFCWDHWHSIIHYTSLWHLSLTWLFTDFDVITVHRFPWGICNGCGMPTGDAYSSGHLVLSHFGTCMCSNVETNLSWTCLVSGPLNFENPSVLQFCFVIYQLCRQRQLRPPPAFAQNICIGMSIALCVLYKRTFCSCGFDSYYFKILSKNAVVIFTARHLICTFLRI